MVPPPRQNLAPSELKKLRNKQRKQRRKAELERQQAAQAQEKREQHNKSRQQTDPDLEQPTLDELIPEKLERVEDPLEQAIKFLQPLQDLASNRIETHLMAFEIYIRKVITQNCRICDYNTWYYEKQTWKNKKYINDDDDDDDNDDDDNDDDDDDDDDDNNDDYRAHRLDANNPDLHTCLVRFLLNTSRLSLEGAVGEVVKRQTADIFSDSTAVQLNAEYLKKNRNSLPHLLQGARMLYLLDPSAQARALSLVTNTDELENVTLKNCTKVLESMQNGDFGYCDSTIAEFISKCHKLFPYATAFRLQETKPTANHQDKENSIKN
uniref:Uncharacterized protein n=1 Tax=Vespula pensylvanica TaxID=30213 RepID=A0A834PA93_VESPE|nr:hypothetical protein H0235_002790 [Vespula pensylvanica]